MDIPGIAAQHAIITDVCRTNRGDEGAIDEALTRLKKEFLSTVEYWPIGTGTQFHLVLTVEAKGRE